MFSLVHANQAVDERVLVADANEDLITMFRLLNESVISGFHVEE